MVTIFSLIGYLSLAASFFSLVALFNGYPAGGVAIFWLVVGISFRALAKTIAERRAQRSIEASVGRAYMNALVNSTVHDIEH